MPDTTDQLFPVSSVPSRCRILMLGVGGAGCNMVARMQATWADGPDAVAVNTDTQALAACPVARCLAIGAKTTRGLGAAGDVTAGRLAVEEQLEQVQELFAGYDFAILVGGLGGGTGSGALPALAQIARQVGVLTLAVVTLPFAFEGERRRMQAEEALRSLQQAADAIVALPNERLLELVDDQGSLDQAFRGSDEVIAAGLHSIWRLLARTGVINLDFADVRQLFERSGGSCAYGYGEGRGAARAATALQQLIDSPLLEKGRLLAEAQGVLVSITGGPDLTLADVQGIMGKVSSMVQSHAHVVMGAMVDGAWRDRLGLAVLVTDNWIASRQEKKPEPAERGFPDDIESETTRRRNKSEAKKKALTDSDQATLPFEEVDKGRFRNVEPTFYAGEDLDIPTYVRRGVKLSFER